MPNFSNSQIVLPGDAADLPAGVRLIDSPRWKHKLVFEKQGVIVPFRFGQMNITPAGDLQFQFAGDQYRDIDRVSEGEKVINSPSRELARVFWSRTLPLLAHSPQTQKVLDILLRIAGNESLKPWVQQVSGQLDSMRVNTREKSALDEVDQIAKRELPRFYEILWIKTGEQKILDDVSWLDEHPQFHRGWTLHALLNLVYRNKR